MGPKKILIVEDQPYMIRLIQYNMENAGFDVDSVFNGEEAINYLHQNIPDLIILDLMMPKMNGLEFLSNIRSDLKTKDLPVIILTARGQKIDETNSMEAGANLFITKPFNPTELVEQVNRLTANSFQ